MLRLSIPASELFDDATSTFETVEAITIELEHSLVSVSKWESKWEKPYLGKTQKTRAEVEDYIRMMILSPEVPPNIVSRLTSDNVDEIIAYLQAKQTATWLADEKKATTREIITAELIYYWMVALTIPFECETWHLNRLLTLVQVTNRKNSPPKKRSRAEQLAFNKAENERRQAEYNTTG